MSYLRVTRGLIISALLLVLALPVIAADSVNADKWQFGAEVYLWGASVDVRPTRGDSIEIGFSDIIDHLDFGFMTTLGARKGKWSLLADFIYINVSDDEQGTADLIGFPIRTSYDARVQTWLVTAGGGYTVLETDRFNLDLLVGTRYLWLDTSLKFQIGPFKIKATPDTRSWDGIIGVRGKADLSDKWYLSYYLDGGTGDTDFTWQAKAGLNYQFKKVDAVMGYRRLDYKINGRKIDDANLNGPYLGVKFPF